MNIKSYCDDFRDDFRDFTHQLLQDKFGGDVWPHHLANVERVLTDKFAMLMGNSISETGIIAHKGTEVNNNTKAKLNSNSRFMQAVEDAINVLPGVSGTYMERAISQISSAFNLNCYEKGQMARDFQREQIDSGNLLATIVSEVQKGLDEFSIDMDTSIIANHIRNRLEEGMRGPYLTDVLAASVYTKEATQPAPVDYQGPGAPVAVGSERLAESINILGEHRDNHASVEVEPTDADWTSKLAEYVVEVRNTAAEFKFRIVHGPSERCTAWAGYTQVAMLDDVCAATEYFVGPEDALRPIATECFVSHWAVKEPKSDRSAEDIIANGI